jgi:nucleotide-binding universal stress UspA family protein
MPPIVPPTAPGAAHALAYVPTPSRRVILVATDGSEGAAPALLMARRLATPGVELRVVCVVEPAPVLVSPVGAAVYTAEDDARRVARAQARVEEQVRRVLGEEHEVPVAVTVGRPVSILARVAHEEQAELVVTGLRHHGRLDRIFLHRETPIGIARAARVPVLAVPRGITRLPRVAVVGVDLDETSVHAVRRARWLLDEAERVHVAHVCPEDVTYGAPAPQEWTRLYEGLTQATLRRVVRELDLPAARVATSTLAGHPADEILTLAERAQAELIVVGYRAPLLIDRLTRTHAVAERVLRGARCAVLLVPSVETELAPGEATETQVLGDPAAWAMHLSDFTERNAGRRAHLEVDTAEMGAQALVAGFPLLGVDAEQDGAMVHLVFGAIDGRGPHLAHRIPDARSVALYRRRDGNDIALRIAHEDGYSLLTFE